MRTQRLPLIIDIFRDRCRDVTATELVMKQIKKRSNGNRQVDSQRQEEKNNNLGF